MKTFCQLFLVIVMLLSTSNFAQNYVKIIDEKLELSPETNPQLPLIPISTTAADERAPFITGNQNYLYTIIEFTDTTGLTKLRIFISQDHGSSWNYRKTLTVQDGKLTLPQEFVFQNKFYAVFQMIKSDSHGIFVYENDDPELKAAGTIKLVSISEDWLERPSIIVKLNKEHIPTMHVAYFDLTHPRFYIFQGTIDRDFKEVYSREFGYPDGFLRIDATAGKGQDLFVFNAKIDSVNQLVVLGHTLANGWEVKFLTQSKEPKFSPSIAAWGKSWIVTFQTGNTIKYFGLFPESNTIGIQRGFIKNQTLELNGNFPVVDITDSPAGKIVCAFVKDGKIYKKESSVGNPLKWSNKKPLYTESIPPSDDDFVSLFPNHINGGIVFASLNQQKNYDVYFAPVAPEYTELSKPTGLTASISGKSDVFLSWSDNSDDELGFKIFREEKRMGSWAVIDSVGRNTTVFKDTTVLNNRTYSYFVRAFGINALSDISNQVEIDIPPSEKPNVFYYRLHVLLKNTILGDIRIPIKEGSLLENQKYFLPDFNFSSVYQGIGSPYRSVSGSYFSLGDISDEDLFLDIFLTYDFKTNQPPKVFNEKLFLYLIVNVFKLPDYTPVTGNYLFKKGEYFTFHIEKKDSFVAQVRKLRLNPDSLQIAYITQNGFDGSGITTTDTKNFIEFKASHFSKFGGGRRGIAGNTDVKESVNFPHEFRLEQNYPNPFGGTAGTNSSTIIKYTLPSNGYVRLTVYDLLGRKVAELVNQTQKAGSYSVRFNSNALGGLPSGVYLYRIEVNGKKNFVGVKKLLLIK
jgi:hypothetical protein